MQFQGSLQHSRLSAKNTENYICARTRLLSGAVRCVASDMDQGARSGSPTPLPLGAEDEAMETTSGGEVGESACGEGSTRAHTRRSQTNR